jgi:hypothetical protein
MILIEAANNFGDNAQEGASAGPMALAVIALIAVVTVLLWRNMTARIKRLPASFPDHRVQPPAAAGKVDREASGEVVEKDSTDTDADADADPKV